MDSEIKRAESDPTPKMISFYIRFVCSTFHLITLEVTHIFVVAFTPSDRRGPNVLTINIGPYVK
jgi:hypothetical protein